MILSKVYADSRSRLLDIADDLASEQLAVTVPALPAWTVKDAYAHLAGVCADNLDGRHDGQPGPAWTARQVDERRDLTLAAICREWTLRAGVLDALLMDPPSPRVALIAADAWVHEQDIRGALGLPGFRTGEHVAAVVDLFVAVFAGRWDSLPTLRLVGDDRSWILGGGEPSAVLTATDFELARLLIGRRTDKQLLAMDWVGDPIPFLGRLNVFGPPAEDLVE